MVGRYYCNVVTSSHLHLAIIRIAPFGGGHDGAYAYQCASQQPCALTWRKSRSQIAVIDFAGYGKAVEGGCREEQSFIIRESIRGRINISFTRRNDTVAVLIHPGDLSGVCIK